LLLAALIGISITHPASAEIVFEEGVEYANPDDQHLKLDLARPAEVKEGQRLPAVLCIHGGGFRAGNRKGWDGFCKKLAERGYVAVTVEYRLAPKYPFPAAVYDVKAAVQWLRSNADKYHIDPTRIGTVGDSAGGHLALFLGVTGGVEQFNPPFTHFGAPKEERVRRSKLEWDAYIPAPAVSTKVQCVVSYYGPTDFTKSYGKSVDAAEVLPLWLGGDLEHARHKHIESSPLYWVTPQAAPTLLLHGTDDKYVNHEQAVWMHDKLKAADVEVEMVTFDGAGHGFKGADKEKADQAALEFFDRHLKKKP
jgi:acetyl esterase/lipase